MFRFYIEYQLQKIKIESPIGWDNQNWTLSRDMDLEGVFIKYSSDFIFIGTAFDFLNDLIINQGLQNDVYLRIEKYNNNEKTWDFAQYAKFDFSGYQYDNSQGKGIKCALMSDGFTEKFLNRKDTLIKLDSTKDIDGNDIGTFGGYKNVNVLGQTVVLGIEGSGDDNLYNRDGLRQTDYYHFSLPIYFEGDTKNVNSQFGQELRCVDQDNPDQRVTLPSTTSCLYFASNTESKITIDFNLNFWFRDNSGFAPNLSQFWLVTFDLNNDGTMKQNTILKEYYDNPGITNYRTYKDTVTVELEANQGVTLILRGLFDVAEIDTNDDYKVLSTSRIELSIQEKAKQTISKHSLLFETLTRATQILTGQADFKSSILGRTDTAPAYVEDGKFSLIGLANGFLYRNYTTAESQLSINTDKFIQDCKKLFNVRCGIEDEHLVIEDRKYFYSSDVVYVVNNMAEKSFTTENFKENFYSKIKSGAKKIEYEESSALSTQHAMQNYTTMIKNFDGELDLEHETNTDPYIIEYARRLQKNNDSKLDSQYDNINVILDLIRDGSEFTQRNKEGFSVVQVSEPIDTFGNLRFTPANLIYRWGDWLKQCIRFNTDKDIIYQRNDAITDLHTAETGALTIKECSNIDPDFLDNSEFTGRIVNFSAPLEFEDFITIESNPYGRIQYINPLNGEIEQGWIIEVSLNPTDKETNWKLIQATPNTNVVEYFGLGTNNEEGISTNNDELIELNN